MKRSNLRTLLSTPACFNANPRGCALSVRCIRYIELIKLRATFETEQNNIIELGMFTFLDTRHLQGRKEISKCAVVALLVTRHDTEPPARLSLLFATWFASFAISARILTFGAHCLFASCI